MLDATIIDLSAYLTTPDLTTKVIPASRFAEAVKAEFVPWDNAERAPAMLARKAQGLQFRPGEVTCWGGYNGHRKSMFTTQTALELCIQRQRTLIMSLEMSPARTMARMSRQAAAVAIPTPAQIDALHKWTDGRLWLFDHVGRIDGETCLAVCRYFADKIKGAQVFIDSMMMVCGSEEHLDEQKQFITTLCRSATETGLHVHIVTHCRKPASGDEGKPPTKYDIKGSGSISDQASNVVTVWANKAKTALIEQGKADALTWEQPDALVTCEKQRNGAWEGRLKFWFDPQSLRFMPDTGVTPEPYSLGL